MVERFCPYLLAVVPTNLHQLIYQSNPNFLHLMFIGCLLQGLCNFLGYPSCLLGSLQLCLQLHDHLFLGGQLYLSMIGPFAVILDLVLGILQTSLSALPHPLLYG